MVIAKNNNTDLNKKILSRCCVALGSNMPSKFGSSLETLNCAISDLQTLHFKLIKCSNFYETEPFPKDSGSKFVNCCAIFESQLSALDVLKHLHIVETFYGRIRKKRWGARIIDLDLIYFDELIYPDKNTLQKWIELSPEKQIKNCPSEMILPHPRLQDRAFVLMPLSDINKDWRHPILGISVNDMLALLDPDLLNEIKKL